MGTSWRTAPLGTVCCYLCKRWLPPEKLEGNRCANRRSCSKAAVKGNQPVFRTRNQQESRPAKSKRKKPV